MKGSDGEPESRPSTSRESSGNFDQTLEDCLNTEEVIERVLVFTTLQLLGLLAVCKRGSVDGTFRCSTTLWKQIFIIMCEVRGVFIPIAICWLPNKNTVSYYAALYLLLSEFDRRREEISGIYGTSDLKLKKIKSDFEQSTVD